MKPCIMPIDFGFETGGGGLQKNPSASRNYISIFGKWGWVRVGEMALVPYMPNL